jgi:hypothetical protein
VQHLESVNSSQFGSCCSTITNFNVHSCDADLFFDDEAHVPHFDNLIRWARGSTSATILADPPWRFQNSTGKVAPGDVAEVEADTAAIGTTVFAELVLFGVRSKNSRTLAPGRRQVNYLATQKREHSRKPDELYPIIEACSPGPYAELFARRPPLGWNSWGDEFEDCAPTSKTYANRSQAEKVTPVAKVRNSL